jgi:ribosomal protein L11 methylase PrmA
VTEAPSRDRGSFRDPSAYVFHHAGRVVRAVTAEADESLSLAFSSGVFDKLNAKGLLIEARKLSPSAKELASYTGARGESFSALYEHPVLPFISYPYEWCFSQLKDAALGHLDLQIAAFDLGFVLSDASAYNMQFLNGRPIHIDVMSLWPYRDGQHWDGYNQFCRQFLLPLLLEAWAGLPFQPMYRGSINGISFEDALAVLPRRKLFTSMGGFMHVYLQGKALAAKSATTQGGALRVSPLPKARYLNILKDLRSFVSSLRSLKRPESYWTDYAVVNTYSEEMRSTKIDFVKTWAAKAKPGTLVDIGGNTGDFSLAAIESGGASFATVLDGDVDAIEKGYRARRSPHLLPLLMNMSDPSPDLGWRQAERRGLKSRAQPGGVIALAVIHHMAIGGNLPLVEVVNWIMDIAPNGIIEFVPKDDPMVREMLMLRRDIFNDYSEEHFRSLIAERGKIVAEHKFNENGRLLVAFEKV